MQDVLDNFNERVKEVEKYYKVLETLDDTRTVIYKQYANRKSIVSLDNDALKIMKSTCFLILYNLVESTIKESFTELYDQINNEETTIDQINTSFRKLWIKQQFKNADPLSSNQNTYREIITTVVNSILDMEFFTLNSNHLPISGNLDARKIRELYNKHSIDLKIHYTALAGGELRTVKDKRNALAHGNISFSQCGQEYTVEDLINIKRKTVTYIKSSLRYIKKYADGNGYAV
ncbi:hypothetical protein D1818_05530 [Aquimarina sp. BL5]|uniref:MAE_28990/MAE_18760 family HEPN-like nuclease n=1 Tax=Aquimarina sp. BL5 TaxID=1714860 RepID=UPI000E4AC4E3|nr:MAE_28990/MAE_18760 family HEPN-like nuclease [Aquimarina sp. BL5]AXT50316.1 hypothetical protein D1818_05530 [Aquimarina sp. BL5]RKM90139.1 hypothetical protein D7036_24120 [Aquimarina sp. BL5]